MSVTPLPNILAIEPYKGGESRLPGIEKPIKLASNENPLGCSPAAKAAMIAAAEKLALYPDGSAAALREAIAGRYGIDASRVVCGAGSDEIFQLLARAFLAPGDEIIQSQYAFLVYRLVAQQSGAITLSAPDKDFTVDVDAMLALVTPRTKIVFIANPNNPTGTYVPYADLRRLQAGLPSHVLLVIDAAYAEYVDANDYSSGLEMAGEHANVLMTRTFSKIHGLAALRLGWAYGPASVIDALHKVRGPFNVNAPALAAGVAALADHAFADQSARVNADERARVTAGLTALGYHVTPSVCNFVLVHFASGQAALADAFLRSQGLIVRAMGAYGLKDALRLSIGAPTENDALLAAMRGFAAQS
jgi:histidinol-phosphate aminotransferase